jgi:hypothetical protein
MLGNKRMVDLVKAGQFRTAIEIMPTTTREAVRTGLPMVTLNQQMPVEPFIAQLLLRLTQLVNMDERLTIQGGQLPFIAKEIFDQFGKELSVEDVWVCFRRGAMGRYDDKLLKLDGSIIGNWLDQYKVERYVELERKLMDEKDEHHKALPKAKPCSPEEAKVWMQKWLDKLGDGFQAPPRLSDEQYQREGQVRPEKKFYPSNNMGITKEAHALHLQYCRENFDKNTGKPLPTWVPEDVWLNNRQKSK